MKILITGSSGFSGKHLLQLLGQDFQHSLYCTSRSDGDLAQFSFVEGLLGKIQPDQIYHLAGSFTNDYAIDYQNNVIATKNILDCLLKLQLPSRVLLIGSAAEYGAVSPEENPVRENSVLKPAGVYGLTKVYQTHLMQYYCSAHHLDIVMARTFNLMGKGMSPNLFLGRVYGQIEEYKKGKISKITVGSLQGQRDYIDIDEAVRCYQRIMAHGRTGEVYNVGSGQPVKMSDLLMRILEEHGLPAKIIEEGAPHSKMNVMQIYAYVQKLAELSS